ncbi:hypothetical protein OAA60_04200 [Porticoccaceae bacterium]|nr:hypothetical protein [Porticoccaceae bacterium]
MATYIKGSKSYVPDIKPFTPDYKFLSAVLETRTDKYDANFKATNDLYNKVVYADLSREDTKERRDQFAEQIGPQIEKISGMDLSLQQNADNARSVFAPFYQDDLTVKDIVFTSKYRDEMAYANRLLDSTDPKMHERYWETGVRGMQYRMDDFINGSEQKALQAQLPKYIGDADLFELATEYLESMDPPLKMKINHYGENEDGTANTDWIITEQNGRLITGAALQAVQSALLDNPTVQRAYQEDAFVKSRDFAAQGMQAGQFTSIDQGQEAWAQETIARINELNTPEIQEATKELKKIQNANVNWTNYQENNGIVPGSDLEEAMVEQQSAAEAMQAALDAKVNIQTLANTPSKSLQGTLNKAYNLLMNYNISGDLKKAAVNFSARDQEYTMEANDFALKEKQYKYDMAKIRANAENDMLLQAQKARDARDLAIAKGEIVDTSEDPNSLRSLLKGTNVSFGDASTFVAATDEDGVIDPDTDVTNMNNEAFLRRDNALFLRQVDNILAAKQIINPRGDSAAENGTYGIKVIQDGKEVEFRGTIAQIKEKLTAPTIEGEGEEAKITGYANRNLVSGLYDKTRNAFVDTYNQTKQNANLTGVDANFAPYQELYDAMVGPNNSTDIQMKGLNTAMNTVLSNHRETYDLMKANLESRGESGFDKNAKLLADAGFPSIMNDQNQIIPKEEYFKTVQGMIANGTIKNPDLWGWDGTDDAKYMIDETRIEMYEGRDEAGVPTMKTRTVYTGNKVPDYNEINKEAGEYYDKLYQLFQQGLIGTQGDLSTGTVDSILAGYGDGSDGLKLSPTYNYSINPLTGNSQGEAELGNLLQQINTLEKKGNAYGIVAGSIDNVDDILISDPIAEKAWNLYKEDLNTWYNNPKRSNTDAIAPIATLQYKPIYGKSQDGNKTTAGYQVIFSPEWLASKVKGGSDPSAQYGALTTKDITYLSDAGENEAVGSGVSFIFQQKEDINVKAASNQYYSAINTDIMSSENGYADYTVPDMLSPTANYRISRIDNNNYSVNYTVNRYIPYNSETKTGGNYRSEEFTQPIDMTYGIRGLDPQVYKLESWFKTIREENRLARKKDQEQYGIK